MMPPQGKHSVDGLKAIFSGSVFITIWNAAAFVPFLDGCIGS
jgi:hypothetical protein